MSNLFYRNPRLTILVIGLIAVAGLASLQSLPRQEDPTLTRRFATITTFYPGATAERVEILVTEPIEQRILEIHEVRNLTSQSRSGVSTMRVELDESYYEDDVDQIWSRVRDHLADARVDFPAGVSPSDLVEINTTAATLVAALVWRGEGPPQLDLLTRLAEDLENRLRTTSGTEEVEIYGEAQEEIRVTMDSATLASTGLSVADVAAAIAAADAKAPAGVARPAGSDLLVEVRGELDSLARVRRVPLRSGADGQLLRVGDVAHVRKTIREPRKSKALVSGRPAVVVAATMEARRRVDQWTATARRVVADFGDRLPVGIELKTIFEQSVYTQNQLRTLALNLLAAGLIVLCVLVFMMGVRSALVVATALPLALLMALAEFNLAGFPLHQTSITGLIIALGLLIDNAIVVVDEYSILLGEGHERADAVSVVVRKLFVPLFASTVTTVLAFLPIILMPGSAGEFVGPISAGVGFTVTSSFVLSMTVIVALAGYFVRRPNRDTEQRWWRDGFASPRLTRRFGLVVGVCLRRPLIGIGGSLILPLIGFAVGTTLVQQFFPANDRNQFQVQIRMPVQASLAATEAVMRRVRDHVNADDSVVDSHWFVGEDSPRIYYNMIAAEDGVSSYAGGIVTTLSAKATEVLLPSLQRQLIRDFPEQEVLALPFEQGPPINAPIEIRIFGPDAAIQRKLGEELRLILSQTDEVTFSRAQLSGGDPKLVVAADEDEARMAGVRLRDVARRLQGDLEGVIGGSLIEGSEEIAVRVRVADDHRGEINRIDSIRLGLDGTSDGLAIPGVPLAALAEFELVPASATLARYNGERTNTIQAFLSPYAVIAESLNDFRRRLADSEFTLPPSYRMELGGEEERRGDATSNLALFAFPLFVVMAGTIILSFNSFRMSAIIFAVALSSVGLAFLGVWMFGYPMGFVAIVGTMGLVGLAINDAIVVLTALRSSDGARAGDIDEARDVVIGATRHVIATTLTTIGGFLPLIYLGGRFWPPMATAIAGGVGGASILALFMVPSMFIWMARRETRRAESS